MEPQLARCGGEERARPQKIGAVRRGQWPAWVAALRRRWVVVAVEAASLKFLSREGTKRHVSREHRLVKA